MVSLLQMSITGASFLNTKEQFKEKLLSLSVKQEIAITDEKIDDLVYKLYAITEKERKIIEG